MRFERHIKAKLEDWNQSPYRKPLLLMGMRQIGKTTILKQFGEEVYQDFLYLNFEKSKELQQFFEGNKNPNEILNKLSLLHGKRIKEHSTLLIFDEIQECKDALISLKYFKEEAPDYHIIGAGSLLGLTMGNNRSFPVGKVSFLDMYPLSFSEYLKSMDIKLFEAYHYFISLNTINKIPDIFFNSLQAAYKLFVLFGSMPEVAAHYLVTQNIQESQTLQDQILRAYTLDFVKHADQTTSTRIQYTWDALPSQLAKENKKFIYKVVKSGARAREYEAALQWLIEAGLVYKIPKVKRPGIPLKAYEDISSFKLFSFETGLLFRMTNLNPQTFISGNEFFTEFKGSIAENKVVQSLAESTIKKSFYWSSNGQSEIDFLIEYQGLVIPIEVKSGLSTKAKSLAVYQKKFNPKIRIRISNLNLNYTGNLINIPLFYSEKIPELIQIALK